MFLSASLPFDEPTRLARLRSLKILDSEAEPLFDALAETAAEICEAPIALISLVDADRQWHKARFGISEREVPRAISFCAHAILQHDVMQIESMAADARYVDHPMVVGPSNIQFYAAAPIVLSDGTALGTLCVLDHFPRALQKSQLRALRKLARSIAHAMESRVAAIESVAEVEHAKVRIDKLYRSTPAALFSMDGEGHLQHVSDKLLVDTGFSRDELVGHTFFEFLTPESCRYAREIGMPTFLRDGHTVNHEYQLVRKDGTLMDLLVSQVLERDEQDRPVRSMSVFEDITLRRRAERELRAEVARKNRIIEGTNAGTWDLNIATGLLTYDERWSGIIGYRADELSVTTLSDWTKFVHPDDYRTMLAAARAHIDGSSAYFDCELRLRHRDGHWVWAHEHARVTERAADGTALWMHGICTDITARKEAEVALHASQDFLERVGEIAGVGGWEYDFARHVVTWTAETCRIHDLPPGHRPTYDEAIGYFDAEARATLDAAVGQSVRHGEPFDLELSLTTAAGRPRWIRAVASVESANGRAVRLVGAVQDITRRKEVERDLARNRELLQVTLDSIADAVITTDTDARVQWLNPVAERMTGWSKADAVGHALTDIFIVVDETTRAPLTDRASLFLAHENANEPSGRKTLIARDGLEYGIEDSASPIRDAGGHVHGAVVVFHDVSEQRRLVDEISHRATHDLLTGLFNRSEFEARLGRLLEAHVVDGDDHVLLYVDLDQFKLVNDACGHGAGDQLLRQVAAILRGCVRGHDTVARLGGDEFGVILEHCDLSHAQRVAQKICDELDSFRFTYESRRFRIGASIGLVMIDHRWTSITSLLQVADASCYAAKDGGRNRVHTWFDSDQIVAARHGDMQWVTRLELALDEDRFELFGQRIESIGEPSRGMHFEVLLRMCEANGTLIPPGAFLPVAERFHLATRIDRWVVRRAFRWMCSAEEADIDIEMMAINLSGQSLGDRAFHRDILQMIGRASFDVRKLCFEITETAAITHLTDARLFIEDLRVLGVKVALDDFGAGASSFGYLKSLPVDFLKIDGHFIKHVLDDELNNAAVRCFCDVAKVVGVKTIAEFVEDEQVRDALKEIGVDMMQGYLVHRPEPLSSLLDCMPPPRIATHPSAAATVANTAPVAKAA